MPFPLNRRLIIFLAIDAVVLIGVAGVFAAVTRAFAPQAPALADRPFLMNPPAAEIPGAPVSAAPASGGSAETPAGPLNLARLLSHDVKVTFHKVEIGENYWSVAKDNDIDVATLIGANPTMPFKAVVNQELNILSKRGVLHEVEPGETLPEITAAYHRDDLHKADLLKADLNAIQNENSLSWWRRIHPGDILYIPDARPLRMEPEWSSYFSHRGFFGIPMASWGKGWTSGFGWRTDPITGQHKIHKGVDFKAHYGESVFAAANGKVIFAGIAGGYGNLIQIRHAKGYLTFYGHLSKILVRQGENVRRGTLIGKVGATGRVTGPHLHFEVRLNGKAIDPLPLI
jgi:hypothetical protein